MQFEPGPGELIIEELAQKIDCNDPCTLYESISNLIQSTTPTLQTLIPLAINCALQKSGKSILMRNDKNHYTALHHACWRDKTGCANLLREAYKTAGIPVPEGCHR